MRKFWEWMVENKYIGFSSRKLKSREGQELEGKATKQMMIGYMIEYLSESTKDKVQLVFWHNDNGDLYNDLKQKIEELET